MLLPFMAWGNLKLFLRQCKLAEANNPQVTTTPPAPAPGPRRPVRDPSCFCLLPPQSVSQQDLVSMAIQIACGMSYLSRREVIHKDLAARNCV